jgi:YD repeat-containing protein
LSEDLERAIKAIEGQGSGICAGNLLNDGINRYQYDAENRISSVNNPATTYTYNADGQRVAKTMCGTTTDFLYDRPGAGDALQFQSSLAVVCLH